MNFLGLTSLLLPFALVACSKAESKTEAPAEAPKAEPAKPAVAPAPVAPPTVAPAVPAAPAAPEARVQWKANKTDFDVTVANKDMHRQLHLVAGSTTFDLPITGGDEESLRVVEGNLVYWSRHNVPNAMEVSLNAFYAVRIAWDAKAAKPVVKKTWNCQEDLKPCVQPAWAGPAWVDPDLEEVDD